VFLLKYHEVQRSKKIPGEPCLPHCYFTTLNIKKIHQISHVMRRRNYKLGSNERNLYKLDWFPLFRISEFICFPLRTPV
jgi:hypothetical protein